MLFDVFSGPSARDLSRMFPTPPSAEMPCSSMSSPMQAAETVTAEAIAMDVLHPHHFTSSTASLTSGRDDGAGSVGSLVLLRKVRLLGLPCKPGLLNLFHSIPPSSKFQHGRFVCVKKSGTLSLYMSSGMLAPLAYPLCFLEVTGCS